MSTPASRAAMPLAVLAAAVAVSSVAVLSLGSDPRPVHWWWPVWVGATLVSLLGLAARRHPRATVLAATLTCVVVLLGSSAPGGVVPLTLAGALTAAQAWPFVLDGRSRTSLLVATTAATCGAVVVVLVVDDVGPVTVAAAGAWTVSLGMAAYLFAVPISRGRLKQARLQRSLDSAASQIAVSSRRAVIDERVRIARDLHDSAGHLVTAITIHAAVAQRALGREPDAAARAIGTVEEYSRLALLEIQTVLRVLDGARAQGGREPDLGALDDLVAEMAGLGLVVEVSEVGHPAALPPTVSAACYRVAREGLLNSRKHSTCGEARVVVRWPEPGIRFDVLEVEVVDRGPAAEASTGSGIGLRGLRERVALEGGTLEAGPLPTGGFHVRARIPFDPQRTAAATAQGETSWR